LIPSQEISKSTFYAETFINHLCVCALLRRCERAANSDAAPVAYSTDNSYNFCASASTHCEAYR
jgi:hypothetical protein